MKITELGFYKTRGGDKVEVVAIRGEKASVYYNDRFYAAYNDGHVYFDRSSSSMDIIESWQEPKPPVVFEGWITISDSYCVDGLYSLREDALKAVECDNSAIAMRIRVNSSKPLKERITVIGE